MIPWPCVYVGLSYSGPEGLDCYGLVRRVLAEQFDIHIPSPEEEVSAYTTLEDAEPIIDALWEPVEYNDRQAGDVLFVQGTSFCHCGVLVDRDRLLHTSEATGAVIERLSANYWQLKLKNGGRIYRAKR